MRRHISFIACAAMGLAFTMPARAQDEAPQSRLPTDHLADIEPGSYLAGDQVAFDLASESGNLLLRFQGSPEVFVLHAARGPLGGRELKYDSGETALHVASWGGITLYTDSAPQGLPAMRTGDALPLPPPSISLADMENAAKDEAERLGYTRHLQIRFAADWNALGSDANACAFAFDTLENAAHGIARFVSNNIEHNIFVRRVSIVDIAFGPKPALRLSGKTLIVTFDPAEGFVGRASSRAIARALAHTLSH